MQSNIEVGVFEFNVCLSSYIQFRMAVIIMIKCMTCHPQAINKTLTFQINRTSHNSPYIVKRLIYRRVLDEKNIYDFRLTECLMFTKCSLQESLETWDSSFLHWINKTIVGKVFLFEWILLEGNCDSQHAPNK